MSLEDYLRLLDWADRQERANTRGKIPAELAPILERLGVAHEELLETVQGFPRKSPGFVGRVDQILKRAAELGRRWLHGVGQPARVFVAVAARHA